MNCIRTLALASLALLSGCDAYVDKAKYDESQEALRKAREQIAQYQLHRYEIVPGHGIRTWRLDTITGSSCILLSSEADFKNPKTGYDTCECEDIRNAYKERKVEVAGDKTYCFSPER
jgi:hypothetical protein